MLARLPNVALGALLGLVVWRWAAELWSPNAGLVALFMFVFEPNIIANSSLATLDVGVAAFFFISLFYLWR